MRKLKLSSAALAACLFLNASFGAAYIKFDGVDGESKDKAHKGWIDVLSVSKIEIPKEGSSGMATGKRDAASGMATGKREAASGMATGKRQHKPVTITKRVDKASPLFQDKGTEGQNPLYNSRMTIEQDGVTYELEGVKVLSSKRNGNTETVTLSYQSIKAAHDAAMNSVRNMKAAEATDYNSSRSNRTTKASDYNSSRSNRTTNN